MAPARGAQPPCPGASDGVPRDHPRGDPPRHRQPPRARPSPGRRPGDPTDPGPPGRIRGVAGPVEEGRPGPVRRSGAVGGDPDRGRTRTGADGVPGRRVVGPPGHVRARRCRSRPHSVPRRPGRAGRSPPGDGQGLRTGRPSDRIGAGGRGGAARREFSDRGVRRPGRPTGRGAIGRAQAVHPSPVAAVHDLDAPAGGGAQAAHVVVDGDVDRSAALRERLHHLHADGLDDVVRRRPERRPTPDPRQVRRRVRPRRAASLRQQGEERPGGPRGDPARRRLVPDPRPGAQRARQRRVPALRADLAADDRVADDRRPGRVGPGPPRDDDRAGRRADRGRRRSVGCGGAGRGVLGVGPHDPVPRVPAGLRRGARRPRRRARRPGADPSRPGGGGGGARRGPRGRRSRDPAAGALHRGVAGQAPGGARGRTPVHLRVDHLDGAGPRLRVAQGHGAGPQLHRVRGGDPARAALPDPGRLRVHRRDGRGPRPHRVGFGGHGAVAEPLLLRRCRRRARRGRSGR